MNLIKLSLPGLSLTFGIMTPSLTAVQAGEVGVGLPGWSHFKDAWIMGFRGKDVVLVMDADEAGRKGTRNIASRFIRAGIPAPRQLVLDKEKDLNDFYQLSGKTEI